MLEILDNLKKTYDFDMKNAENACKRPLFALPNKKPKIGRFLSLLYFSFFSLCIGYIYTYNMQYMILPNIADG